MFTVASYCTTFLKPEMLHVYRQLTGLTDFKTFAVCRKRINSDAFPFPEVELVHSVPSNFIRRKFGLEDQICNLEDIYREALGSPRAADDLIP